MSSRPLSLILVCTFVAACVAPRDTFDEFGTRVIDASTTDAPPGEFADISGEFLLAVTPVIAPSTRLQFIATAELTMNEDGTATTSFRFQPLSVSGRMPVGSAITADDITINANGTFEASIAGTVPGAANPISGQNITADIVLHGVILNEDTYCGDVTGEVTQPSQIDLTGSTFGAIRIAPGTLGDDLPDPVGECPVIDEPDAGVPDAGVPDAGVPDAGLDAGIDGAPPGDMR